MSTLRTTNLKHGASAINNIVLDNQGRSTFGNNALFVNAQTGQVGVNTTTTTAALTVNGTIESNGATLNQLIVDTSTLVVDSVNNRVGIGTTTPTGPLDIVADSNPNPQLIVRGATSSTNGILSFPVTGGGTASILAGTALRFHTNSTDANTNERMRILSNGRVGIGTTSPQQILEVATNEASSPTTIRISNLYNGIVNESTAALEFYSADASNPAGASVRAAIDIFGNGNGGVSDLRFLVNDGTLQERARLRNNGFFGIGEDNPQQLLHQTQNTGYNIHRIQSGSAPVLTQTYATDDGNGFGFVGTFSEHDFIIGTNNSARMRALATTGYVGIGNIGASSIETQLHSYSNHPSGVNAIFQGLNNDNGDSAGRRIVLKTTSFRTAIQGEQAGGGNTFTPNDLLLNPDGNNVAVGVDGTPNYKFTVQGQSTTGGTAISISNLDPGNNIQGELRLIPAYDNTGNVIRFGGANNGGAEVRILRFVTSSDTERLRIEADGRIVLPTGSPGIAFDSNDTSGAGVDSKSLDDYEEGTFTPTLTSATAYTVANGQYTRIGDVVYFTIRMQASAATPTGASLIIGGLPYTAQNVSATSYGGAFNSFGTLVNRVTQENFNLHIPLNRNEIRFYNGSSFLNDNSAGVDLLQNVILQGFYFAV